MLILRQSTAIDIRVGPFVDPTDGVTPVTGITLGAADQAEVLKADGAATTAMAGTFAAITGADGWYDYTVATGDVDTVGEVVFVVQDASACLPVFVRAMVVEESVFDRLYAASAVGPLTAAEVNAEADTALTDYDPPTKAELDSGFAALNDPTAATVAAAVWDALQTAHTTGGSFGEIATEIASILADTNELQTDDVPGLIAALNDLSAAEVNAEMVDVMATDTHSLPGQAAPPLAPTYEQILTWTYKLMRNAKKQSATEFQVLADDESTVDTKAAVSTAGGVTTSGELVSGP